MDQSHRPTPTEDRLRTASARIGEAFLRMIEAFIVSIAFLVQLFAPESARAMSQRTGDFELEMDAPWRIEPRGGLQPYGAIPIQVSIHDADQPATGADALLQQIITVTQGQSTTDAIFTYLKGPIDALLGPTDEVLSWFGIDVLPEGELPPLLILDRFESLRVDEEINGNFVQRQTFTIANIHEIERSVGVWQHNAALRGPESAGTPPARPVHSICRRWQSQDCTSFAALRSTSEWHMTAFYTPSSAIPGRNVRLRTTLTLRATKDGVSSNKTYQRFLTVHLAEQPLPKFDSEWAYGDLHYHSQGTDNDGESGYSYRGTVQAMNAMGLDFAFATDHASNSPQIGSAEPQFSSELVRPILRGLRDMSPDRFAFGIDVLNAATGANRQVVSFMRPSGQGSGAAASQLFLGAEVDVAPETYPGEVGSSHFCYYVPKFLKALDQHWIPTHPGDEPELFWCDSMSVPTGDGRELLLDVQGPNAGRLLSTDFYARQHMIHLPVDPQRKSSFIASNTSKYGGGTRRLGEILDVELGQRQKGYAFLAHPFSQGLGDSVGALGPDLISYTRAQLDDAFKSPHILGLQIWNEDSISSADANDAQPFESPHWEGQKQPFLDPHFQRWDLLQLQGLDTKRTASLSWIPAGDPRRFFAAGGSDAHGDFNYRREGYFLGTDKVNDTAIGKPRNLVHVGPAAGAAIPTGLGSAVPLSQQQVVEGLRSGNFAITDGPAVRIMVDVNGNGQIDASDVPMGGVHKHVLAGPFKVIVEWKSTPEFAPVESIRLLLGAWADEAPEGMVYMPQDGNPHVDPDYNYRHANGTIYTASPNIPYWYDPNAGNPLSIPILSGEEYAGRRVVTIDPEKYPVGRRACSQSTAVRTATTTATRTVSGTATVSGTTTLASAKTATTTSGTPTPTGGTVVYMDTSLDQQLEDLINGNFEMLPPPCGNKVFADPTRPDRIFVRAEVRNKVAPDTSALCSTNPLEPIAQCVRRVAYTNPVWVRIEPCTNPTGCYVNETNGGVGGGGGVIDGGGSSGSGGLTVNTSALGQIAGTATTTTSGTGSTSTTGGVLGTASGTLTTAGTLTVAPTTTTTTTTTVGSTTSRLTTTLAR